MARRKVTVELELEVARANRSAAELAVVLRGTKAQLEDLGDEADGTGRDLDQLAANTDVAKHQVDDLGDKARGTAADLTLLDARIRTTEQSVRRFGLAFARGDESVSKQLNSERSMLGQLKKLRKELEDLGPPPVPPVPGGGGGEGFGRMSLSNPYVLAGAGVIAASVAPGVGAIVAGIIAGAIGTGGVAGGLLMASRSPQVLAAASDFGDSITKEFFRGGDAFVGPAIESLDILKAAFMALHLPETFAVMAPDVKIIAGGLADLALNTMPGLNMSFARMGPFARVAATGFGDMGDALSDFLDNVTASPGAIEGLMFAFNFINQAVIGTGRLIHGLSDTFDVFINVVRNAAHLAAALYGALGPFGNEALHQFFLNLEADATKLQNTTLPGVEEAASGAAHGFGTLGLAAGLAAQATGDLRYALSGLHDQFLDVIGAEINAEQALDDLQASLEKYGTTLDSGTAAGRENLRQLRDFAIASRDAAQAKFAETGSVEEAQAVYDAYRVKLLELLEAEHFTADQAQALIDKWLGVAALPDINKTITITTYSEFQEITAAEHASRRAAGGPVLAGRLYQYNEQQPEYYMRAPADGWIMPLGQAPPGGSGAAGSTGAFTPEVHVYIGDQELRGMVRVEVRETNRATARRVTAGSTR